MQSTATTLYLRNHPLADLATLFFLVSGAMNYFATCNLWDRFYKARPEGKKGAGK